MDLNKAQIIGRITQVLELKQAPNGQNVTSFGVATGRSWTDGSGMRQEQTEFHNVVLWGKLAEIATQYLGKGRKVYIEGRLQTRHWEAQDGTKRYRTEIIGENMIMLENKKQEGVESDEEFVKQVKKENGVERAKREQEEINIEDIPF